MALLPKRRMDYHSPNFPGNPTLPGRLYISFGQSLESRTGLPFKHVSQQTFTVVSAFDAEFLFATLESA